MYNSPQLANTIKAEAKSKGIIIGDMLRSCGLGINTMSHLNHGKSIAFDSLAKIADYLNVSVDYLLGREEKNTTNINTANNSQIDNSTVIGVSNGKQYDETTNQVAEEFSKLSFSDKIKVMSLIAELNGNK